LFAVPATARDVSITVFGLFHPTRIEIAAVKGEPLLIQRPGQATRSLSWPGKIAIDGPAELPATAHFTLRVPGRIERRFFGRLVIRQERGDLISILITDIETAVASIVAAESPGSPKESLRVQAVVARSFLLAGNRRHRDSDFCDTTHCQFLRSAPDTSSQSARAAYETRGMVLTYHGSIFEAFYSANCGGRTRTLADARFGAGPYPYFAVDCPVHAGAASGHRIGLCQRGSIAMARSGASWRDILRHYFPGAVAEPNEN
jgi:peptidoglycan hydrolase-like amidase